MLNKKTVDDLKDLKGKKVLVRCDFNVPLKDGVIQNFNRIDGALPTIKKLLDQGAKVILCSHLGKPKGEPLPEMSLSPVAPALSERLGVPVKFISDPVVTGEETRKAAADLKDGEVLLLENTRYRVEETKYGKDEAAEKYAEELAALCDDGIFVDDAFGTAHRAHCSNVGVTKHCKENVVGYLMEKEIRFLGQAVENPVRPFVAILGGAKVSDKLNVINNLLDKVDTLIIGGGMAYTFLKAEGQSIGNSLCEEDKLSYCLDMLKKAEEKGVKLLLPVDHVAAEKFAADAPHKVVDEIPEGYMGLDIGPKSIARFTEALQGAKTVVWNGPMGVFEFEAFAAGTLAVCKAVAELKDATTVVGGGDVALGDALYLARLCQKVYLIHRRDSFRGAKILEDKVRGTENIELVLDSTVEEIRGEGQLKSILVKNKKSGAESELAIDGLFIAVGIVPESKNFPFLATDERGYVLGDESCETNVPGVYAAGDVRKKQLRQVITAVADGANAVESAVRYLTEQ